MSEKTPGISFQNRMNIFVEVYINLFSVFEKIMKMKNQ